MHLAYAHIKQDNLLKCVFIGYPEDVKGYKFWKMKPNKELRVMITKDVALEETCIGVKCKDMETINSKT